MKIKDYIILSAGNTAYLRELVRQKIDQDWEILDGPFYNPNSFAPYGGQTSFHQAMILRLSEEKI